MRVEARVEEGDRDPAAGVALRGAEPHRGRQDRDGAPGEAGVVGLGLPERGAERVGARRAEARLGPPPGVVREDEEEHLGVEVRGARRAAGAEVGPAEGALARVAHGAGSIPLASAFRSGGVSRPRPSRAPSRA